MVQSTTTTIRPPPTSSAPTPRTASATPVHTPPSEPDPPSHLTMPMAMAQFATDRNLIDQLRMIYQTANRHLPVPSSTVLTKALEDALDEISKIAERAVEAYKPPS